MIFNDNNFIGHTHDKEKLNKFLCNRKARYDVVKIKDSKIDKDILHSDAFFNTELLYYEGYNTSNDYPLFQYELDVLKEELRDDVVNIERCIDKITYKLKYLKISKDKCDEVIRLLESIVIMIDDSVDIEDEFIYDDIFDVNKYIKSKFP